MIEKREVLSLKISLLSYNDALEHIINLAQSQMGAYVCFANVHMTIEAVEDRKFAEQVNNANLVLPDGMPLVKALKSFYGLQQDRVAGMDAFPDILKRAEEKALKIFLFGTTQDVLEIIQTKAKKQFPGIQIVGAYSPAFNKPINNPEYIEMINNSKANIVCVALGCPKQEKWMADNYNKMNAVLLGVGGAFPIYAQLAKRAPAFMRNMGLEWLYRLIQEPRRLFKRYFKTNTKYMYLIFAKKLKFNFNRK